jgi:hypothetical protein
MNRLVLAILALLVVAAQVSAFVPATAGSRLSFVRYSTTIKEPSDGDESDAKITENSEIPAPIAQGPEEGQIPGVDELVKGEYQMAEMAKEQPKAEKDDKKGEQKEK